MEDVRLLHLAKLAHVSVKEVTGKSQKKEISLIRKAMWYILKSEGYSNKKIARMFHKNSHSTVVSGIKDIKGFLDVDDKQIKELLDNFNLS